MLLVASPHFFGQGSITGDGAKEDDICLPERLVDGCGDEEEEAVKDVTSLVVIFLGIFLVRRMFFYINVQKIG